MSWYITPSEYEQAAKNGISAKCLTDRVRRYGWDIKRAVTQPIQNQRPNGSLSHWTKIAETNGVCRKTFYERINQLGWTLERAATTPTLDKKEVLAEIREKRRKIPQKYYDLAKANGIKRTTLTGRVLQYGWPLEKAATTPAMTFSEAGVKGGKSLAERTAGSRSREYERCRVQSTS